MADEWKGVLKRFQEAAKGRSQAEIAALDTRVGPKDVSRWMRGVVKEAPTGPKLEAMRAITDVLERGAPDDYQRGVQAAIERAERFLTELRALLAGQAPAAGQRSLAARTVDAAKRRAGKGGTAGGGR